MKTVNKGTRIANYFIDTTIISIIASIIAFVLNHNYSAIPFYPVFLIYYFAFESLTGQTPGKIITKTIVVDMHNLKPSIGRILLRTIFRLNPFDSFSYLFGQEQGAHDLVSKTRLKNIDSEEHPE